MAAAPAAPLVPPGGHVTAIGFLAAAGVATVLRVAASARLNRESFPWGTLAVNVTGAFALGLLAGAGEVTTVILAGGALGSLTTFSTLAVEAVELWRRNRRRAAVYVTASLVGGVAAAYLGVLAVT
ncbi:MAG: CrcB family protein [Acidimicrobiia bacterium]|nr:CrcB family protein [Acidimicrobiia bacterium]